MGYGTARSMGSYVRVREQNCRCNKVGIILVISVNTDISRRYYKQRCC